MKKQLVKLSDIQKAQKRIHGVAFRTPLIPLYSALDGQKVWLKPESLQPIGAFKIRGAYNRIAQLVEEGYRGTVIAYSSGNHAQGVAYAAKKLGLEATIVMPNNSPKVKVESTRSYGANIIMYDPDVEDREVVAANILKVSGGVIIPPYNDLGIIAGQGTIGLEIYEDLSEVDLVITSVGGGGLISGTAAALKNLKPSVKIIGVEPELVADAKESLESGKIVELKPEEAFRTIADGVRTLHVGDHTLAHMRAYVDRIITVSEREIIEASRKLLLENKLLIEPSGALPLAAYLFHHKELPSAKNVVLVLSGGNADSSFVEGLVTNKME